MHIEVKMLCPDCRIKECVIHDIAKETMELRQQIAALEYENNTLREMFELALYDANKNIPLELVLKNRTWDHYQDEARASIAGGFCAVCSSQDCSHRCITCGNRDCNVPKGCGPYHVPD
jgi:hypothetical protein